jgi:hypothetical protein
MKPATVANPSGVVVAVSPVFRRKPGSSSLTGRTLSDQSAEEIMVTVPAELAEIHQWWARRPRDEPRRRIAGSAYDQLTPAGIDNPYWELVRQLPSVLEAGVLEAGVLGAGVLEACVRPDGFARELPVGHHLLTKRYAWAIPSPGDIDWLTQVAGDRGLVEIGAGSGYWAWQARQAGIDVVAYEPADASTNPYTDGTEYAPILRDGHPAARHHSERALLLCWPSHNVPWAAGALRAYRGDLVIYIGQEEGGNCADDEFFHLLQRYWTPVGASPHHVSWHHTGSKMTAYRRCRPGGTTTEPPAAPHGLRSAESIEVC